MLMIDANKRYEIGQIKKDSIDSPTTGEYVNNPQVLSGEQLLSYGITNWNEFFKASPPGFHIGKLYFVFQCRQNPDEPRKYITHGTISKVKSYNDTGLKDDFTGSMQKMDAPHNVKFYKEQINELNAECRRLNSKIDTMQNELMTAKEKQLIAEQELSKHIGLNDAINQKEEEYLNAIEKVQKEQQDSSNKIMENLMMLAQQGLSIWMQTQQGKNQVPIQNAPTINDDYVNSLKEGDIVKIKNASGTVEDWTFKIVNDKKIIVSSTGKMKSF
jgi:hypothetical protein